MTFFEVLSEIFQTDAYYRASHFAPNLYIHNNNNIIYFALYKNNTFIELNPWALIPEDIDGYYSKRE